LTDGSGNYSFQSSRSNPPCNPNEWSFQAFIAETVDDEPLLPSNTSSSSGCAGPGTVTLGNLTIARPQQINLGGIVRDAFGTPAQGLTVTMTRTKYNLNPPVITTATTTTDANGHYQFTTWSRCSVVEEFKASIKGVILQGGTSTSGCVLSSNDNLNFNTNLGLLKQENAGFTSCNGSIGEPVNVANGNVYLQQSDFQLPSSVGGISITRIYNSISQNIGLFGRGWTTDFDERVVTNANNQLELTLPDGRLVTFATPDFFGQIVKNGNSTYTVTFKDGRVHQFDVPGKLLSMTDLNGNQTVLTYDGAGKLTAITDPFGRVLTVTTNSSGRVLSIADSLGTIATYTYTSDRLLSVTYPNNSAFQFSYISIPGGFGLTSITDALANIIEQHEYDGQGRAISSQKHGGVERYTLNYVSATQTDVTDALNRVTKYFFRRVQARYVVHRVEGLCSCGGAQIQTWNYNDQVNVASQTNALNNVTSYTYDANGNQLTETDATGTVTYSYNSFGQVLTRTNQINGVTTNTYNAQGNLLTTTDPLNKTTTFAYDYRGQMLTTTDARNNVTTFTWDGSGRLTQTKDALNNTTNIAYDARARVISATNALNQTTNFEYDLAGRPKKIIYPDLNFVLFTYDLAGRRTKIKDPRGFESNFAYDADYRLITETDAANQATSYGYDLMSNQTSVTDALGRVTNYEYDDFNRLKKVIYPPATTGATRLFETIVYDAAGNATQRTDTAGRVTSYAYDTVNRLISTTDAANKTTTFQYDGLSRVTSLTDAINQQYQFVYDVVGRQTQMTRAGVSMSYQYDAVGNRTRRTDYNGAITNYNYDSLNRLTTISYPDSTSVTYNYDALSRLSGATNANGTVTFSHDNRGRVSSTTDVFNQTVGYSYDPNSNRTAVTLGGAANVSYVYDSINRLTHLTDSASLAVSYSYDVTNQLTSHALPNGVLTTYEYDGLDRLNRITHQKGATPIADFQYQLNDANNISQITELAATNNFSYDAVDRLTAATHSNQPNESFNYDGVGNRTSSHLSASYSFQPFNKLTNTNSATYSYDNNGNLISKTDGTGTTQFWWDFENRLTQVTLANGNVVSYKYDALGRRIERNANLVSPQPLNTTQRFVYDGADVIRDLDGNGVTTADYLNGPGIDNKLRQTTAAASLYFIQDHLGSTRALTDTTGNIIEQQEYDSFGNSSGSAFTRYGYTGRERDPDTGMLYYRARFYDPEVGRFASEDPIGFESDDENWYSYISNDPVNDTDPSGLKRKKRHSRAKNPTMPAQCKGTTPNGPTQSVARQWRCDKTWTECWAQCIETHRLDNLVIALGTSALPKRILPPFRVTNRSQRLTTVMSSAAHLLRKAKPGLAKGLRFAGRNLSRVGTPLLVFEGYYDLGIIAACAELCNRNPCN
jgi:RHS repeat-associated protein